MSELDVRAEEIRKEAQSYGLTVRGRDGIITVSGSFKPGDHDAFYKLQGHAYSILGHFRQVRAGTTWGTEGVAGPLAIKEGRLTLNKSGVESRLASRFR
jgi:hypothetical protein